MIPDPPANRARRHWLSLAVVLVAVAAGCSSGEQTSADNSEFCAASERSFRAVAALDQPGGEEEFRAASEAVAAVDPPREIASDFALVISLEDGTDGTRIIDQEQYDTYQSAERRVRDYFVVECGIDEALVDN